MKERPILFSGPMVRALLAGTKTQTRRVCKNNVRGNGTWSNFLSDFVCENDYLPPSALLMDYRAGGYDLTTSNMEGWGEACPYGQPGDRLWVRETWQAFERGWDVYKGIPTSRPSNCCVLYAADDVDGDLGWRPSIHMPRWASRITLEITSVRVERLQEISEADALAEGIPSIDTPGAWTPPIPANPNLPAIYRGEFCKLWSDINGADSWDANPWVWVVEFKQLEQQR